MPAIQHRSNRQRDRRNVDGGGGHEQRWRGLVTADHQDHTVKRIDERRERDREHRRERSRAVGGRAGDARGREIATCAAVGAEIQTCIQSLVRAWPLEPTSGRDKLG